MAFGGQKWQKSPGIPLVPTARGYAELKEYFAEMGNCEIEVFNIRYDSESDCDVREVSKSKRDRGRMRIIDAWVWR